MREESPDESQSSNETAAGRDAGRLDANGNRFDRRATDRVLPRWVFPAVTMFWTGFLLTFVARHVFHRLASLLVLLLVSLFLALAVEPGVNRLAVRGWRRGRATISILFGVLLSF